MKRLTPNTVLHDRFLFTEELAYEIQNGQQVWAVQDRQTGQALIARLHADGRIEWFNDNRPAVPVTTVTNPPVPSPVANQIPLVNPTQTPVPTRPSTGKRILLFFLIVLLFGGFIGVYYYQKPILAYVQSIRLSTDSTAQKNVDSPPIIDVQTNTSPIWEPATPTPTKPPQTTIPETETSPIEPIPADVSTPTRISVPQALRMLNLLKQIPTEKHPAIFRDARQAFIEFRQQSGNRYSIDSLYTMCMGRGAQSFMAHQQNGDVASKQYAFEWYQLAFALKPSKDLAERIERISNTSKKPQRKSSDVTKKTAKPMFFHDLEVNR